MAQQKRFAYGTDEISGVKCPVATAGHNTELSTYELIASAFDEEVWENQSGDGPMKGTVPYDEAKKCWESAMKKLERDNYNEAYEKGMEITEEVFE